MGWRAQSTTITRTGPALASCKPLSLLVVMLFVTFFMAVAAPMVFAVGHAMLVIFATFAINSAIVVAPSPIRTLVISAHVVRVVYDRRAGVYFDGLGVGMHVNVAAYKAGESHSNHRKNPRFHNFSNKGTGKDRFGS